MNWDWDKLQEKRQQQQKQGWGSAGKGNWGRRDDDHDEPRQDDKQNGTGRGPSRGGRPSFSWPNLPQMDGVPKLRWWILAALVIWFLSGIYIVQPDESGVVLRFGRYVRTETPGPHIHLPYPIETVYKPKVTQVRQTAVGYRAQSVGGVFQQGRVQAVNEESAMLTGDENIINVQFAELCRQHNDANIITLSGRFVELDVNKQIVDTFLTTKFEGGRHAMRVKKIMDLDADVNTYR